LKGYWEACDRLSRHLTASEQATFEKLTTKLLKGIKADQKKKKRKRPWIATRRSLQGLFHPNVGKSNKLKSSTAKWMKIKTSQHVTLLK
jgi:hypothetical protein